MSTRPTKQDAERCRRLARETTDERTRRILLDLADEHEALARGEGAEDMPQSMPPAGGRGPDHAS